MKGFTLFFTAVFCLTFGSSLGSETLKKPIFYESEPLKSSSPNEQRDEKFYDVLSVSLKINVSGASGSGTICHYDESTGFAHVISCGHLWSGNMDYNPNAKTRPKAQVVTWYKNSFKLKTPEAFDAEVLFWSNEKGYDVSLMRFKPNWTPTFSCIDESFVLKKGLVLNSLGCDGGREVARYDVVFEGISDLDIITSRNSPRPGRSGGGLITDSGKIVGVCWGTSDVSSGKGTGYFTPVSSIKKVFKRNGHGWLIELMSFKSIPVIDRDNPVSFYKVDFVPSPGIL